MNRDEGAHYLSHVYDPLLATSYREPSDSQPEAEIYQYQSSHWRWPLTKMVEIVRLLKLIGFDRWNLNFVSNKFVLPIIPYKSTLRWCMYPDRSKAQRDNLKAKLQRIVGNCKWIPVLLYRSLKFCQQYSFVHTSLIRCNNTWGHSCLKLSIVQTKHKW